MMGKNNTKWIVIILLLLWAIYALWPTYRFNTLSQKEREKLENKGKLASIQHRAIRLGLDLKGGMHLTLEVDFPYLVEQLAKNKDPQFETILNEVRKELNISTEDFLTILERKFKEHNVPLNKYWGQRGESDGKILSFLDKEGKKAITRSMQILTNRIDQFGVSEPSITKMGSRRILVELPGIEKPEQARNLIKSTALLEFKLLKDPEVFSNTIKKIDRALAKEMGVSMAEEDTTKKKETAKQKESKDKVVSVSELFGEQGVTSNDTSGKAKSDTSILVDERIFKKNPFIALLRSAGGGAREVSVPVENIAAVNRILAREDIKKLMPPDAEMLWSSETFRIGDKQYKELFLVKKDAELTGKYLTDAKVNIGQGVQNAGRPVVNFTLNRRGGRIIGRVSKANINRRLAIVLDNKVVSAPRIQSQLGMSSQITGIPTMDEAKMIAIVLRAGALPTPVKITQETTVGPTLGKDSIKRGSYSTILGFLLVIIFMVFYYKMSGIIADVALVLNLLILAAVLAQFRFTLTLPGMAGIVLTIGMAVDANVLVFERIREELNVGKTVKAAIDAGYSRAFRTIFDANLTTLMTAIVLYQFGTGPIRGFAVTLSIGIVVSMFTALFVTRVIFNTITSRRTLKKLSI